MAVLGVIFLILIALVVLIGLVVLALSLPDIARYRRLRNM